MQKLKKLLAVALILATLVTGMVLPTGAATLYFTSLNDSLEQLSNDTMPLWSGGWLYVPLTLFSPGGNTTGVDLGMNISYSPTKNTATLFNLRKMLVFDLNSGTCYNDLTGEQYTGRAISRNGRVYVPLATVCQFFGLSWSYNAIPTVDQGYLVRVKDSTVVLDDPTFMDAGSELIARRLRDYDRRNEPPKPVEKPTPTPAPSTEEEEHPASTLYLGYRPQDGEQLTALLDQLEKQHLTGVFFLTGEQILAWGPQVQRIAGTGHTLALAGEGDTLEEVRRSLEEGQRALERTAYLRSWVALAPKEFRSKLREEGWVCWRDSIRSAPGESQGATTYGRSVIRKLDNLGRTAWLTLEGEELSRVNPTLLLLLKENNFEIRLPLETRL